MTVEIAEHAGFCMGVRRAVEAAEAAAGDAEHYAELAASVFHVEGDVTFAVAADGGVSMIFTEE